jgi:HKD family nuclease
MRSVDEFTRMMIQPGEGILSELVSAAASVPYARVRVAVAFATEQGVGMLLSAVSSAANWESATKLFLVGIDHGITQPEALQFLARQPNTFVRVPAADEVLSSKKLVREEIFHPKTYCFDAGRSTAPFGIVVGSANLSVGGLTRNAELCVFHRGLPGGRLSSSVFDRFNRWWGAEWRRAYPLSSKLLVSYKGLRDGLRRSAPDRFATEEPSPSELSVARSFWIASGFLSGGSHNQLELPQGVEGFFGALHGEQEIAFHVRSGGRSWESWLRFWGNQVWRLRLPTVAEGLGGYEKQVLRFDRTSKAKVFDLKVIKDGSSEAMTLERRVTILGTLRKTTEGAGGRKYGWS